MALMKPGGVLLNFARAQIVDDAAVLAALEGRLARYVTDFPTPRTRRHPKVIALPHLGASTREAEENCAVMVAENVRDFPRERQHPPLGEFPGRRSCRVSRAARASRLRTPTCRTWSARSRRRWRRRGLNISDLLNKSRGELAYTLADVDGKIPQEALAQIGGDQRRAVDAGRPRRRLSQR
jgi:D-3-phosphoglycerate dehydrogenase / 2-oxoglutarate reductase